VCFHDVYDWETALSGNIEWVLYHSRSQKRASLVDARNTVTERWTHYLPDRIDTYEISYRVNEPPAANTQVPLVDSKKHNFGVCPVVCLALPKSLQIASRLKTPQLAHFRAVNMQSFSLSQTCYAQTVARVNDPEAFGEMIAGAGFGVVIGVDEDWGFEAPPAQHFGALDVEIKAAKDEIHRIAYQMHLGVENNAAAIGRTAESKSQDAEATRVSLTSYGRVVKAAIERVYDMISASRGDKLSWDISGMDDFAAVDTSGLITLATDLTAAGGIPSKTFNGQLKIKLAEAIMPDLDEKTKETIRQEIVDGVENEPTQEEKELAQFEAMHQIVNDNAPPEPSGSKSKGSAKGRGSGAPAPFVKKKKGK
jgi:hypothetical protein